MTNYQKLNKTCDELSNQLITNDKIINNISENSSNNICKICFENTEFDNFIILNCQHKLCKNCFKSWSKTCPWCRQQINLQTNPQITVVPTSNITQDCCEHLYCKIFRICLFLTIFIYFMFYSIVKHN